MMTMIIMIIYLPGAWRGLLPQCQGDENSTAAIYGMASSMPAGPVNVLLRAYTDVTLGS